MNNSSSKEFQQAAAWIETQHERCVTRLERWCNHNSWSSDLAQLQSMAELLCEDFSAIGVDFFCASLPPMKLLGDEESWVEQETGPALLWHHQPKAERRILLMIHYDTVYPNGSAPSKCARDGDRLVGPGTADAKGGIAVIALAIEAILKFNLAPDIGVSILLNPDEEVGSTASSEMMSRISSQFNAALLFEPTLPSGALVAERKGSGNFAFVARGKSAHAGRNPDDGRNAIVHLSRLVPRLTELHNPDQGVLLNVGRIAGGDALNQVPDHAVLQLNTRVSDNDVMREVTVSLEKLADEFTGGGYRVALNGSFTSPPKLLSDDLRELQSRVESAGRLAGRSIAWENTGGACDGSKLAGFGLANIDTMGVSGGNLHNQNEFCELESLMPAAKTVAAFVSQFAD